MDQISTEASNTIQNHMEIDDRLLAIATIEKQISDYEDLKKHRVASVQREIDWLEQKRQEHRDAIQTFMKDNGEKSLNYPGVGKVMRKIGKAKWVVNDEDALLKLLVENVPQDVLEKCVVAKPKIVKKELDPVLDKLSADGKLNEDVVAREAATDVLTVTLDKGDTLQNRLKDLKDIMLPEAPQTPAEAQPKKLAYDELEI